MSSSVISSKGLMCSKSLQESSATADQMSERALQPLLLEHFPRIWQKPPGAASWFGSMDSDTVNEECLQDINNDLQSDSNLVGEEEHSVDLNIEDINKNLTPDIVVLVEKDLSTDEKVSLVFLIDDIPDRALQTLKTGFANTLHLATAISDWARSEETNWRYKFLESLTIIQNYEVIEKIGYSKNDVQLYFPIFPKDTKFVDRIKKELYLICEAFTYSEAEKFISLVKEDTMTMKNFEHFQRLWGIDFNTNLEICFLQMLSSRYIINDDEHIELKSLNNILKRMGKVQIAYDLDDVVFNVRQQRLRQTMRTIKKKDHYYPIFDKNRLGLFIVINQVTFEQDPSNSVQLDERKGTEKDIEALYTTFKTKLKMDFVEFRNIQSHDIVEKIRSNLKKFEPGVHSMLFVCILSHGCTGTIYGSDSKEVELKRLEDCLFEFNGLKGIPKVLIVQACQNKLPNPKVDIVTDGPDYKDLLKCMATREGLTAFRHKKDGSWYIQSLCKNINQYKSQKPFLDIVQKVHQDIHYSIDKLPKDLRGSIMTPCFETTLTKPLYLQVPTST